MNSFFSFGSSSKPTPTFTNLETQLEVTVTPSAAAFYAGEVFSATISFTCKRKHGESRSASTPATSQAAASTFNLTAEPKSGPTIQLPRRIRQIGLTIDTPPESYNAEAGPSRLSTRTYNESPDIYTTPYSPGSDPARGWPRSGSPVRDGIPGMRSPEVYGGIGNGRGKGEGRRARSLALKKGASPQEMVWALGEQSPAPQLPSRRPPGTHIPSAHPHSRKISITSQPTIGSPTPSVVDLPSIPESTSEMNGSRLNGRPPISRVTSSSSTNMSSSTSHVGLMEETPRHPSPRAALPFTPSDTPPPTHPYIRSLAEPRETTILWAHTRLTAHFQPSNHYIPPDPLLPLRSLLLHQPIGSGSGSLTASPSTANSSWQLSFGTGTIGQQSQPSLTGSLVGLASSLVYGGSAGSLEEERKKAWNTKDLPVLETPRSLVGVDIRVTEGETKEFVYSIPIPKDLPPTHKGRAYRFGWEMVLSLAVGDGAKQRMREIEIPIKVWNHVNLGTPAPNYDVLQPTIQTRDNGTVTERSMVESSPAIESISKDTGTTTELENYARQLLDSVDASDATLSRAPSRSPSRNGRPSSALSNRSHLSIRSRVMGFHSSGLLQGEDDLTGMEQGCSHAVDVLSRHSAKASYDIAKDGELVSVLTLLKTTYRLGEAILGFISINQPPSRPVLKFSAYLESYDLIPPALLPLSPKGGRSPQPNLVRVHADHCAGYANQTGRLAFHLDIPLDSTPSFAFEAGREEPGKGGVEWRIRLAFLVSTGEGTNLVPAGTSEGDNRIFIASQTLAPVLATRNGRKSVDGSKPANKEEIGTETVECEIPIRVLPGNTAFKVKPSIYTV